MSDTKSTLLGMPFGTASARLLKNIVFDLIVSCDRDTCCRCGEKISSVNDMSIEHIVAWASHVEPLVAFFDLANISFSHRKCNYAAATRPNAKNRTQDEQREVWRDKKKRLYTKEARHAKYLAKGY